MKTLFIYLLAALLWPLELLARARRACTERGAGVVYGANIAEGRHQESVTKLTDAAITTRHLLYKVGTDGDHIAVSGAADIPMGVVADEATAAEENVSLDLLGKGSTKRMVASEAIAVGEKVYTAASGKVQDAPTGATVSLVGIALTAAAADGDIIEVADCIPVSVTFA